jgi:hypothetical protein
MGTRVGEHVPVWRPATEEATFDGGLCGHSGTHARLDPVAFALAHASVEAHHQIVRVRAWIDCSTDLGHPEFDAVVHEHREREPKLVAVEGTLRLSDDNGVPAPLRIAERVEQTRRLGPALPRQRARLADVEVLRNDLAARGLDDLA